MHNILWGVRLLLKNIYLESNLTDDDQWVWLNVRRLKRARHGGRVVAAHGIWSEDYHVRLDSDGTRLHNFGACGVAPAVAGRHRANAQQRTHAPAAV